MIDSGANSFPHLLSPFAVGSVALRNRFVFQPHFTALPDIDGMPNEDLRAYVVERAIGGAGLIIDGHLGVMYEGTMSRRFVHAWDQAIVPNYADITHSVHAHGAKIFAQLTHGGHTTLEDPPLVLWAPTQMPEPAFPHTTRAMDRGDIARTVRAFAISARNAIDAGFDGIEVKIAHDGLLRSFASPFFNRRVDEYGGSFEKRMRLSVEVLEAILEEIGSEYPIGVRICLNEYTPFGYELDYGLRMAEHLEARGLVSYWNCDAGTFSSFWMEIPPAAVEQGFFRPLNRALKAASDLPVIAFGRIKDADMAERMVGLGEADLIGMARQLIADPDTPRKLSEGRAGEIRACIGCNDGCIHAVAIEKGIRCVQNPGAGQELRFGERLIQPAGHAKNVVVVGGGVAGLKVAEVAARRGHKVTLLERGAELGGQVRLAARQPLHQEIGEVTAYLEAAVRRLGVDIRLNADADVDGLLELGPDAIMVATGSAPNLPDRGHRAAGGRDHAISQSRGLQVLDALPGMGLRHVYSTDEAMSGAIPAGANVLVIDAQGHWEASGTAEYLADLGCSVEVATRRPEVGFGLEATNKVLFHQRAREKGIRLTPSVDVRAIEEGATIVEELLTGAVRRIGGLDAVIPAYPRASRDDLYFALLDRLEGDAQISVERVGDASAPRLIQAVMLEAHRLGMEV